jgi:hypothetical protein
MDIRGVSINGVAIGDTITSGLYAFTTFTFQTANNTGPNGPTLGNLYAYYSNVGNTWLQSNTYFNVTTAGYQRWTVPTTGSYQIEVAGSRGGISNYTSNSSANVLHGRGAVIRGTVNLTQGQILTIAVGQPGNNAPVTGSFSIAGSGGGSFVVANTTPLIIAGGGASAGMYNTSNVLPGGYGVTGTSGGNSFRGGAGGTGGAGGNAHVNTSGTISQNVYDGGGGGGFFSNGVQGNGGNVRSTAAAGSGGGGGGGFQFNLTGGIAAPSWSATYITSGGFGGGGGPGPISSGGGGGYSGGGGGYAATNTTSDAGGGGGSYIDANVTAVATSDGNYNSSNTFNSVTISNIGSYNNAPGYVRITRL